jgi:hypothetical protein
VDEHTGRVEHALQARPAEARQLVAEAECEIARIRPGADLVARALEHGAGCLHRAWVVARAGELVDRRKVAQMHARPV